VKAGRVAALAGLALSVGFGAQAVTTSVVSHWIMESRARAVINAWLDAARASAALLSACNDKKNELVTLVTERRLPSGRWGRRSVMTYRVAARFP
jgi:hypothetical protein